MANSKDAAETKQIVGAFLDELGNAIRGIESNWKQHVSPSFARYRGWPAVPQYLAYEVVSSRRPPMGNPLVMREVEVALQLVPSGGYGLRWVRGTLRCIKESDAYKPDEDGLWYVVPTSWRPAS